MLRRAWQARDLQVLTAGAAQLRSSLGAGYGLDCLNYIAPDGRLLVGGDGPYSEGALVSRATLRRAMARGGDAWGLETGPLGNYSLRYVRPLYEGGAVSGYLELGMSADLLAAKIGRSLDLDLSAFARKAPGGAVVHNLHQEARLPAAAPRRAGWSAGAGTPLALGLGGRAYSGGLLRLKADGGQAELAVMDDVTPETAEAFGETAVKASAAACFIFLALALMWPARARSGGGLHQRILNSLARGFLLVDRDGRIAEANEAYCLMTGYTPGELKGRPMKDLELGKLPAETAAGAERTRHRRKDGTVVEVKSGLQWIGGDGYIAAFIEKAGAPAPARAPAREKPVPLYTIIEADEPAVPTLERLIGEPDAEPAAVRAASGAVSGGGPASGGEGGPAVIKGSF